MKENKCFNCHRMGHRASECRSPKQNNYRTNDQNKFQGIKKTATTARAMIRSLVADMEEDETTTLLDSICGEQDF